MIEIQLERDTCQGYGNCVLVAPDVFALDAGGTAELLSVRVGARLSEAVRKAAYDCPTEAISLVEHPDVPPDKD